MNQNIQHHLRIPIEFPLQQSSAAVPFSCYLLSLLSVPLSLLEQQQQLHYNSKQQEMHGGGGGGEFNLREWGLRARMISRENTISRRFSASNISRLREDNQSFRSNFTISSTASSPGYPLGDVVDPSTYSFTTALRALQARTGCVWECLSPEGLALNSKWNEAEKYMCNPLSGEFPMECLSAKTLSGRSLHNFSSRITMSAPLIYPSSHQSSRNSQTMPSRPPPLAVPGKKLQITKTRNVGIQSTPAELSSGSSSPSPTLTIADRTWLKRLELEARESRKEVSANVLQFGAREVTEGADQGDERGRRRNEEHRKQRREGKIRGQAAEGGRVEKGACGGRGRCRGKRRTSPGRGIHPSAPTERSSHSLKKLGCGLFLKLSRSQGSMRAEGHGKREVNHETA